MVLKLHICSLLICAVNRDRGIGLEIDTGMNIDTASIGETETGTETDKVNPEAMSSGETNETQTQRGNQDPSHMGDTETTTETERVNPGGSNIGETGRVSPEATSSGETNTETETQTQRGNQEHSRIGDTETATGTERVTPGGSDIGETESQTQRVNPEASSSEDTVIEQATPVSASDLISEFGQPDKGVGHVHCFPHGEGCILITNLENARDVEILRYVQPTHVLDLSAKPSKVLLVHTYF